MRPFDKLTATEKEMIDLYREYYAYGEVSISSPCNIDYLLRLWDDAKDSGGLFELFGNELIIKKEIHYKDDNGVFDYITKLSNDANSGYNIFKRKLTSLFSNQYLACLDDTCDMVGGWSVILDLISPYALAKQSYFGNTHKLRLFNRDTKEEEKTIIVQYSCKPVRVLNKIAKFLGIEEEYEKFRIEISMASNKANLHGKFCLSIHPLDYMTMSDNDSGWGSCMSWEDSGCYRQGTVEMMNSRYVVVGYLESSNTMTMPGGHHWNNKKWRTLYVVGDDFITSIKDYPYHSKELSEIGLDWLKELTGKEYTENFNYGEDAVDYSNIDFNTYNMYNDFHNSPNAWMAVTKEYAADPKPLLINYSGYSECMACGSKDTYFTTEEYLICEDCNVVKVCEYCDDYIGNNGESYEVDGMTLCQYCFENETRWDTVTEEYHLSENFRDVFISVGLSEDDLTILAQTDKIYELPSISIYDTDEFCELYNLTLSSVNRRAGGWGYPIKVIDVSNACSDFEDYYEEYDTNNISISHNSLDALYDYFTNEIQPYVEEIKNKTKEA